MNDLRTRAEVVDVYHVTEVADEYVIVDYLSDDRDPGMIGYLEGTSDNEKKEILDDLKDSVMQENNKDYQGKKYQFNFLKEFETLNSASYSVRKLTPEIKVLEKVRTKYRFRSDGTDNIYKYHLVYPNIQYSDGEEITFDLCLPAQTDPDLRMDLGPQLTVQIKGVDAVLLKNIAVVLQAKYQIYFYNIFYIDGISEGNILENIGKMKEAVLYMSKLPDFKNTRLENLKEIVL